MQPRSAWPFALVLTLACQRAAPDPLPTRVEPETPAVATPAPSPQPEPSPQLAPLSGALVRPAAPLVLAIGDLHGDLDATRRALQLAGAIDESDHWVGGTRVVVQTGDEIDRGDDDRAVLDLFDRLRGEAKQAGGELIALSGNHELMNVQHDYRYVTPGSFASFGDEPGRRKAFDPGGPYAKLLAARPMIMKVGDNLFVHGGILLKHVVYGLNRMSDEVGAWMRGERPEPPAVVASDDGPIWTRSYSTEVPAPDCQQLGQVLAALGAKRMVVGHTVQPRGINSACNGQVWRIDVGLSHFYGGPMQVLELTGEQAKILRAPE